MTHTFKGCGGTFVDTGVISKSKFRMGLTTLFHRLRLTEELVASLCLKFGTGPTDPHEGALVTTACTGRVRTPQPLDWPTPAPLPSMLQAASRRYYGETSSYRSVVSSSSAQGSWIMDHGILDHGA